VLDSNAPLTLAGGRQLDTLKEVASAQNTPAYPTAIKTDEQDLSDSLNLEKRLPTLPNTPSSAYPPSTIFRESVDIDALQSHFSSTTIDTSDGEEYNSSPESFRFSNWSASYPSAGHSSYYTESFIDEEPMSAARFTKVTTPIRETTTADAEYITDFEDTPQPPALPARTVKLTTAISSSSMSTASNLSMPASPSYSEHDETLIASSFEIEEPMSAGRFKYQHYRLPEDEFGSEITLKSPIGKRDGLMEVPPHLGVAEAAQTSHRNSFAAHSSTMQQLMDELAYLGDMIHQK
jgi:hypothetical protein